MTAKLIGDQSLKKTWADLGAVTMPPDSQIESGWIYQQNPPYQYSNSLLQELGKQDNYLLRSGIPAWHTDTPYQQGDICTYDDAIWQALQSNTGHTPENGSRWERVSKMIRTHKTYTIDSSGADYTSIYAALHDIVQDYPAYILLNGTAHVTLEIQSGYTIQEQILVRGVDLSWIEITSVDPRVTVDTTWITLTMDGVLPFVAAWDGGTSPIINFAFDLDNSQSNCVGLYAGHRSTIIAKKIDAKDSGNVHDNALVAAYGGHITCSGNVTCDGFTDAIKLSQGKLTCKNVNIANHSGKGILANESKINHDALAVTAGTVGLYLRGTEYINAMGVTIAGCSSYAIDIQGCSVQMCTSTSVTGTINVVNCTKGINIKQSKWFSGEIGGHVFVDNVNDTALTIENSIVSVSYLELGQTTANLAGLDVYHSHLLCEYDIKVKTTSTSLSGMNVSWSDINCNDINVDSPAPYCMEIDASTIHCNDIDVTSFTSIGIKSSKSAIKSTGDVNAVMPAVLATGIETYGSEIAANNITCTGQDVIGSYGISARGSRINAAGTITTSDNDCGIEANRGSVVSAGTIASTSCLTYGIHSVAGSEIAAYFYIDTQGATTSGATAHAARISCQGNIDTQAGGSPATTDCQVINGGWICRAGGNGGTNVTVGTINANGYINV